MARPTEALPYGFIYQDSEDGLYYKVARMGDDIQAAGPDDRSMLQTGRDVRCPLCAERKPHSEAVHETQIALHRRRTMGRGATSEDGDEGDRADSDGGYEDDYSQLPQRGRT